LTGPDPGNLFLFASNQVFSGKICEIDEDKPDSIHKMKKLDFFLTRRDFLQKTAAGAIAAPLILQSCNWSGKLRHACIGVGGMGKVDLQNFISHPDVEVVAICDVDAENLRQAAELVPGARTYSDWRELLKTERRKIDSINVAVPDHNHFAIAYTAIGMKKHVYCQKPMCHDVAEVRLLTEASVKNRVKTQLGTQHASSANDRLGVHLLRQGAIGKIRHAYLCSNRPSAINYRLEGPRPGQGEAPPAGLDWDLWTGTAPVRPYAKDVYHPMLWRTWLDFGTGWSGDIGCHIFDAVWKGLGLTHPVSVMAEVQKSWQESPARRSDTWPQSNHITWMFPGNERTESSVLPLEWFDGEFYPPQEVMSLFPGEEYPAESAMLIGTEGALLIVHGGGLALLPQEKFTDYPMPQYEERNHYHHFIDACLGKAENESHFAQTGPMTETVLLGTVAIRVPDTRLEWDPVNLTFPNHPQANQYLRRAYRAGWEVGGFG
jgi:predicted dehydrogenase